MQMKSLSEIAVGLIIHIHDTLPEVDTKEGTFIRDVFIDPTSTEIADLYKELKLTELSQSIVTAEGPDLDKLARNFFVRRKDATYATGKIRFYIGIMEPEFEIVIPRGAVVGSPGDANNEPLDYMTTASVTIVPGDSGTYQRESDTGQYYVDIEATSLEPGLDYNADANTITLPGDVLDSDILAVTNPFPFTGGSDEESDLSLMMRVSMAITGVNIGTKDGYISFLMKQNEVEDAIVVGAGEPLMLRDNGEGGMVDIYVRMKAAEEDTQKIEAAEMINNLEIDLRKQPVLVVDKIVGKVVNFAKESGFDEKTYINGSNYKREKGSNKYFRDIKWIFNTISTEGLKGDDLLRVEATNIITENLKKVDFLQSINHGIQWQFIEPINDNELPLNSNFYRGYYSDSLVYIITTKDNVTNPFVRGKNFIMRDGEIYQRIYVEPDFIIEYDQTPSARSINAKDKVKWISTNNLPKIGETLYINYSWNSGIESLQERLDEKRILTADVLLKQSIEVPIEIKVDVVPLEGYPANNIKSTIINTITSYIDDMKKLGASIDRSDIAYMARGTEGVEAINLTNIHLSILDAPPVSRVELKNFEYMKLERIYINVLPAGTVV